MIVIRVLRVCLHVLVGLCLAALFFPWVSAARRDRRVQSWSSDLLAICGVSVEIRYADGAAPAARALIVANHVSWLDIFVINSLHACRFVAKSELRDWPVAGWLSEKAGTVYISRGGVRDVRRIFKGLVEILQAGEHVGFFPEGTTSAQGTVLPFYANLFEAAIDAKVPIQPYAIRYVDADGSLSSAVDFIGDMSFVQSLLTVFRAQKIVAQLTMLPVIATTGAHRRELAVTTRRAITESLGY